MIALDTNILIRFLTQDDPKQAQLVYKRFKAAEGKRETLLVPLLVVLETIWVLESVYELARKEILEAFGDLMHMQILRFEKENVLQKLIVEGVGSKADLSDLLIALSAEALGCETVLTFDRKASKHALFSTLK